MARFVSGLALCLLVEELQLGAHALLLLHELLEILRRLGDLNAAQFGAAVRLSASRAIACVASCVGVLPAWPARRALRVA